jgi:hypothetical protein
MASAQLLFLVNPVDLAVGKMLAYGIAAVAIDYVYGVGLHLVRDMDDVGE